MPEPEVVVTAPAVEVVTTPALTGDNPPQETALTRTEVAQLIAAATAENQAKILDAAQKIARRSENKSDTAIARLAKVEAALEVAATRGMDEGEARLWKAERAVERASETSATVTQQQEYEAAQRSFEKMSGDVLNAEKIDAKDPHLVAAFNQYISVRGNSPDNWEKGLFYAVAEVHKNSAIKASNDSKALVDKAREDERAKLRNEQRANDGAVDKGTPASAAKFNSSTATDAEFRAKVAADDAARLARQRQFR